MDACEIPRWQEIKSRLNNLSFDAFKKAIKDNPGCVVLDVRTAEEFDPWHLKGAINIDYLSPNLADLLETLNPNKTYYVYCRTSRRSLRVCVLLGNMGFNQIFNLEDGVKDYL